MDEDDRDQLIRDLILQAGHMMEDLSPELALALPPDGTERASRIAGMLETATTVVALLSTAARLAGSMPRGPEIPASS